MHVFHFRGFSSILMFVVAILLLTALLLLLPSAFLMVLWNALIFEGFRGPEIGMYQGFLLWGFILSLVKIIFKPEIQFQILPANPVSKDAKKGKSDASANSSASTEDPASADSKNS